LKCNIQEYVFGGLQLKVILSGLNLIFKPCTWLNISRQGKLHYLWSWKLYMANKELSEGSFERPGKAGQG